MVAFPFPFATPRVLKSAHQFDSFSLSCQKWMGVRFPVSYLNKNRVIGFYTRNQKLVGGFALITQPPFRVIESLPPEALSKFNSLNFPPHSLFEITGLWLHPEYKNRIANVFFYLTIYKEILFLRRPYFIYAFSSSKPKLGQLYSVAQPVTIYCGPTQILPGMDCADDEVIQVGSVEALNRVWLSNPGFLLKRLRRSRSASFYQPLPDVET
ncbi:MAG: hypothetical protein KDD35_00475 [Bdellovibrionales bacterium]|nr:hypothetical protein [Bdellovibrionales bacterium]